MSGWHPTVACAGCSFKVYSLKFWSNVVVTCCFKCWLKFEIFPVEHASGPTKSAHAYAFALAPPPPLPSSHLKIRPRALAKEQYHNTMKGLFLPNAVLAKRMKNRITAGPDNTTIPYIKIKITKIPLFLIYLLIITLGNYIYNTTKNHFNSRH